MNALLTTILIWKIMEYESVKPNTFFHCWESAFIVAPNSISNKTKFQQKLRKLDRKIKKKSNKRMQRSHSNSEFVSTTSGNGHA